MVKKTTNQELNPETSTKYQASGVALVGKKDIKVEVLDPKDLERFMLAHPVLPSGIDKKANRIINRSFDVVGGSDENREYCRAILKRSGDELFIKKLIKNALGFGTAFAQMALSKDKKEVIKAVIKHPIYFGYYKEKVQGTEDLAIVFDPKTGTPKQYSDYIYKDGIRQPEKGSKIPYDKVIDLKFDTWGDEIEGIPILQYITLTLKQLLNMEDSAAEQMYRNGFTQKKFTTNIRSINKLKDFAKTVKDASDSDAIVLLDGTDVENLQPGNSDFVEFHKEFLTLLAIALGIPQPLLTMDGNDVNKSTMSEMRREMYEDSFADELIIKTTIDEKLFVPACLLKNPSVKAEDIPSFVFKKRQLELNEQLENQKLLAETVNSYSMALEHLSKAGQTQEVKDILEKIKNLTTEIEKPIEGKFTDVSKTIKKKGLFSGKTGSNKNHNYNYLITKLKQRNFVETMRGKK